MQRSMVEIDPKSFGVHLHHRTMHEALLWRKALPWALHVVPPLERVGGRSVVWVLCTRSWNRMASEFLHK